MCPFGETPIPTELKVRLFCNIGCRRCNESTRLTKRNTRQNILHLDLCTITARWNKVLILGTWNATHLLPSVSRNICITPFITGTLSNTACSLSSPWAWQSSRNISADRVCLFDKVSVLGDTIKGTPVYIYTHILMGHLYISTHNYILMGHSVHIYTQLHTDGTPCIYLHTITYCLDILYISTHNTYWWDTLYISTHNYILMGHPVYIYTQLHAGSSTHIVTELPFDTNITWSHQPHTKPAETERHTLTEIDIQDVSFVGDLSIKDVTGCLGGCEASLRDNAVVLRSANALFTNSLLFTKSFSFRFTHYSYTATFQTKVY